MYVVLLDVNSPAQTYIWTVNIRKHTCRAFNSQFTTCSSFMTEKNENKKQKLWWQNYISFSPPLPSPGQHSISEQVSVVSPNPTTYLTASQSHNTLMDNKVYCYSFHICLKVPQLRFNTDNEQKVKIKVEQQTEKGLYRICFWGLSCFVCVILQLGHGHGPSRFSPDPTHCQCPHSHTLPIIQHGPTPPASTNGHKSKQFCVPLVYHTDLITRTTCTERWQHHMVINSKEPEVFPT